VTPQEAIAKLNAMNLDKTIKDVNDIAGLQQYPADFYALVKAAETIAELYTMAVELAQRRRQA